MNRALTRFVILVVTSTWLEAQTTIYWKKDHITDASGQVIAVATPAPSDQTAPSTPTGLGDTTTTATSITLAWNSSTDNSGGSGMAGYVVYRGAVPVAAVSGTSFTDVGLLSNTNYVYKVSAFDNALNYSDLTDGHPVATDPSSGAPLNLTATASSTTQINLSWTAPSSAPDHYGIWRLSGGDWSKIGTAGSTSHSDTTVSASTAYLYKISAENSSNTVLGWTNVDLATTIFYTDDPLTQESTIVKAVHLTELRAAVNTVRAAAGLSAANWTDSPLSGATIKAVHVTELRTNLGDATNLLGMTAANFTDSTLTGVEIKKAHIDELRQRTK